MSLRAEVDAAAARVRTPADARAVLALAQKNVERAYAISNDISSLGGAHAAARELCDQAADYIRKTRDRVDSEGDTLSDVARRMTGLALVQATDAIAEVSEVANQPGFMAEWMRTLTGWTSGGVLGALRIAGSFWPIILLIFGVLLVLPKARGFLRKALG